MKNLWLSVNDFVLFVLQFIYYITIGILLGFIIVLRMVMMILSIPFGYKSKEHTEAYKEWRKIIDLIIPD